MQPGHETVSSCNGGPGRRPSWDGVTSRHLEHSMLLGTFRFKGKAFIFTESGQRDLEDIYVLLDGPLPDSI